MANSRTSFTLKVSCQSCHFNLLISDCDVGLTITTLDKKTAKDFEPYSSSPEQRLNVLDKLHKAGIKTYAFIGPILPEITNLEAIFKAIKGKADLVMAESLNTRCGNWGEILEVIKKKYPHLLSLYQSKFSQDYWNNIRTEVKKLSSEMFFPFASTNVMDKQKQNQ